MRHLLAANNKTAAFAGRCFVRAYRRGGTARQADQKALQRRNNSKNNGLGKRYYFTTSLFRFGGIE
jgi:hypothetical protein